MLTNYDYIVIVAFFFLMLSVGFVFKKYNKTTSDYFRSGGSMVWQLVGATTFMSFISAVTYTGAAGKAYEAGTLIFVLYFANGLGFLINGFYFSYRFRQSRMVTAIEMVRDRFGKVNEQFFTWMVVPFGFIHGGVWLYSLCIIVSTLFGLDLNTTIIAVGLSVLVMTLLGGSWAVVASDFIQLLIMLPMAIVLAIFSIVEVGGVTSFFHKLPSYQYNWTELANKKIIWIWVIATLIKQFFSVNNMSDGYRFLAVKDSNHARKAAYMSGILFFTMTIAWFIPPMVASILHPDLSELTELAPLGTKAVDGIYLSMGIRLLPTGMLGIMVCAIFSATMSSMDSSLNKNAGIFVKNFYKPILRPTSTDKELMTVSYIVTLVLGAMIILSAVFFSQLEGLNLYDLNMRLGAMISLPFMIPLTLGMIYQDTPRWAGWSTVVLGMFISWFIQKYITADMVSPLLGIASLTKQESIDTLFFTNVLSVVLLCSAWFLGSRLFKKTSPEIYHDQVKSFFTKINTPVNYEAEHGDKGNDKTQYKILGLMSLVYGIFITLLILVPNDLKGRLSFLFVGCIPLLVSYLLIKSSKSNVIP